MRLRLYWAFCLVLFMSIQASAGKDLNKTKTITHSPQQNSTNDNNRNKRSVDGEEIPYWPQRGRRLSLSDLGNNDKSPNNDPMEKEPPFWGTRGRRDDSSSIENSIDSSPLLSDDAMFYATRCKNCDATPIIDNYDDNKLSKEIREEQVVPFWGNRGKKKTGEDDGNYPFWGNRGRRQEEDPFWGARGRREDELPFWGNRGRRYSWGKGDIPNETPFWGNRGRRDEVEPFWGNRGRRDEAEPFWGNQDRLDEAEPFWGNRGRRDGVVRFWGSRGRRDSKNRYRENIKNILHDAIDGVKYNIESLARFRRNDNYPNSFWKNRSRESKLSNLFKIGRHRFHRRGIDSSLISGSTVNDDRFFANQPHFILIERSSRSSTEDDPFFISRGKKMFTASDKYPYSARGRRGSLEELVKSVRNDPYYIVRGKKHLQDNATGNSSLLPEELNKAKEMICATIDLIMFKGSKIKREMDNDNDRDRRTILKKLAAQLQMDPYFASRGKKNESGFNEDNLKDFINEVSAKCN